MSTSVLCNKQQKTMKVRKKKVKMETIICVPFSSFFRDHHVSLSFHSLVLELAKHFSPLVQLSPAVLPLETHFLNLRTMKKRMFLTTMSFHCLKQGQPFPGNLHSQDSFSVNSWMVPKRCWKMIHFLHCQTVLVVSRARYPESKNPCKAVGPPRC